MPRRVVHVITDLPERPRPSPRHALAAVLRPIATLGIVALPLLGAAALVTGLVLDWHPVATLIAAIVALPILVNLVDLVGAAAGWPALWWTVRQVHARRKVSADE